MFVAVRDALRPARRAQRDAGLACGGIELQRGLVAIQVIARRRREAQQQRVAVAGDRLEAERLFRRQRQRVGWRRRRGAPSRPPPSGAAGVARGSAEGDRRFVERAAAAAGSATVTLRVCGG